jgi:hypothetical protein
MEINRKTDKIGNMCVNRLIAHSVMYRKCR